MEKDVEAALNNILNHLTQVKDQQRLLTRKVNDLINTSSLHLGGTRMVTSTRAGQKMFIDGRDTGSGFEILTSGQIEPNVMKVLQRAFMPNSVFLDIGTNFGFYTMMAANQVGPNGKVYSFEANPNLIEFIERSAYINGLSTRVQIINKAVSDVDGVAKFGFNFAEIGGGSLAKGTEIKQISKDQYIEVPLVKIDDALPPDVVVSCAKLDVEGNEAAALRGMRDVIARSPNIMLVLEFFPGLLSGGRGQDVLEILEEMGLGYWRIDSHGRLEDVSKEELTRGGDCYIVAARSRPDDRTLMLGRDGLKIPGKPDADGRLSAEPGAVIVHGPYWYLQRGRYEISIFGDIQGEVRASFTHEFGYEIAADILTNEKKSFQIALAEDVRFFEVVLRQVGTGAGVVLDHIEVRDIS